MSFPAAAARVVEKDRLPIVAREGVAVVAKGTKDVDTSECPSACASFGV